LRGALFATNSFASLGAAGWQSLKVSSQSRLLRFARNDDLPHFHCMSSDIGKALSRARGLERPLADLAGGEGAAPDGDLVNLARKAAACSKIDKQFRRPAINHVLGRGRRSNLAPAAVKEDDGFGLSTDRKVEREPLAQG